MISRLATLKRKQGIVLIVMTATPIFWPETSDEENEGINLEVVGDPEDVDENCMTTLWPATSMVMMMATVPEPPFFNRWEPSVME